MKVFRTSLLAAWVIASGGMFAQTPANKDSPPKAATKAVAPEKKKEEPMGHVDGMELTRPGGGFLGLEIKNSNFVLSFYNAKRKKIAPDVTRATMRWPVKYQPTDERTVLNAGGDGTSLTSGKTVKPPHSFKVFMALFVEGNDTAVETYNLDYRE